MADTKAKKARFTGPITLGAVEDAAPVKKDTGIDLTQFKDLLRTSFTKREQKDPKPGFAVTVPNEQASVVKARFRSAAKELDYGMALDEVTSDSAKGREAGVPAGHTRLVIEARKKKAPRTVTTNGATAANAAKKTTGLPPVAKKA